MRVLAQARVLLCEHISAQTSVLALVLERSSIGGLLLNRQRIDSRNRLTEFLLTSQFLFAERFGARIADFTRVQGITFLCEINIGVFADLAAIRLDHFNRNILCHNS